MAYDRFLIAPFDQNSGLTTNLRPWQIPDNAWAELQNMYIWRGRIRKRFGSRYMGSAFDNIVFAQFASRFRINLGPTNAMSGNLSGMVPGNVFAVGQAFSIGDAMFTVYQTGTPATMLKTSGTASTYTYNTTNGDFVFVGAAKATNVYFYPATPVMGLPQYEFTAINSYVSFGFDTQFAYIFTNGAWQLSNGSPTFHGSDSNFFWAYNWVGPNSAASALTRALFISNYYVVNPNGTGSANDDDMYYWNGTTWTAYIPYLNPGAANAPATGPFVQSALLIIPFHDRLVLFNTIENDGTGGGGNNIQYVNRARYTNFGSPFSVSAWYGFGAADNAGNMGKTAGWKAATTLEAIVSAEFIKDRLIVYFEESTWEFCYTGNENDPFVWQKLNTELGSQGTFSTIAFDKAVLTVGETGIHSCNGSNVARIDQKIPDSVFQVSNIPTSTQRIYGIRDYYAELVYWTLPQENQLSAQPYPSQVLVYNYENDTWAFNDDCITAFGYWDGQQGLTWATIFGTWEEWTSPWNAGSSAPQVRQIIAGNQQGYVFVIDIDSEEVTTNASALQITNMTNVAGGIQMKIYNHMLDADINNNDYIYVSNGQGTGGFTMPGDNIYEVQYVDANTIVAFYPPELVEQTGVPATFTGTYTGGAVAKRVSNPNMYSKQWNPYDKDGRNVYVAKIDFGVINTLVGEVTVNYSPSSTPLNALTEAQDTNTIMGTGVLETGPYPNNFYPLEAFQNRLWHPIYLQVDGECIQINITMSPIQICTQSSAFADFQIEGMILHTTPTSARLQ
jgi:hypothetical protein